MINRTSILKAAQSHNNIGSFSAGSSTELIQEDSLKVMILDLEEYLVLAIYKETNKLTSVSTDK